MSRILVTGCSKGLGRATALELASRGHEVVATARSGQPLTIRAATPDDAGTLRRLAELDGATPLAGPVLLAELDGMPVAAAQLETGSVAADPCQHSADAVQMLMLRRYQLMRQGLGRHTSTRAAAAPPANPAR
jgi:NAD(P)-dependent dehydrogenase (short-subunit alcohol dehydrogenase family)